MKTGVMISNRIIKNVPILIPFLLANLKHFSSVSSAKTYGSSAVPSAHLRPYQTVSAYSCRPSSDAGS